MLQILGVILFLVIIIGLVILIFILINKIKARTSDSNIWEKHANELQKYIDETKNYVAGLDERFRNVTDLEVEGDLVKKVIEKKKGELQGIKDHLKIESAKRDELLKEIALYDDNIILIELGFYEPHFDFDAPEKFKVAIKECKQLQKEMLTDKCAIECMESWSVGGSAAAGRKMINKIINLTARAFNNECDASITNVNWKNAASIEKRIEKTFDAINKLNEDNYVKINFAYFELKLMELRLVHEHKIKQQEWKDEQAEIKAQMKEAEEAQKKIDKEIHEAEKEEELAQKEFEKIEQAVAQATGKERLKFEAKLSLMKDLLTEAQNKNKRAKSLAQQTKRGYVYVLSNQGSFGDGIYKIGMTRREKPEVRVKELGDASVPFLFDVHAMILCDNAPALEKKLHHHFHGQRVNLVNNRKEFFYVNLNEVEAAVNKISKETDYEMSNAIFTMTAQAKEYNESLAIRAKREKAA